MGFYSDQILPRFIDKTLGADGLMRHRGEVAAGLTGSIVEIGFGSGLNVAVYPAEVDRVFAVEPRAIGRRLAADRIAASPVDVEFVGLDGQSLPLDDDSCDGALSTFTLCTIPDEAAALAELVRVVRPGGRVNLLEHGRAPDDDVRVWQRRLNPIQRRVGDGCHLDRDHPRLVEDAGLEIEARRQWYAKGPKPMSAFHLLLCRVPR
ncbi:MAG: methyltransferase domain-containing protein [Actinomycetota bacterium]